jgi:DNA-binding response OmpR family regulator
MATRVLLVDDNPHDRLLATRALTIEFPDLQVAEILDQLGLDRMLERLEVDVIVTDYQLRWSDGLQVLAAVRQAGYGVPVVMFTQTGSEEIAAEGLRAGLADYIVKTATG